MKVENRAATGGGQLYQARDPSCGQSGHRAGGVGGGGGLNPRGLIATNFPPIRSGFQRKKRRRKTVYL